MYSHVRIHLTLGCNIQLDDIVKKWMLLVTHVTLGKCCFQMAKIKNGTNRTLGGSVMYWSGEVGRIDTGGSGFGLVFITSIAKGVASKNVRWKWNIVLFLTTTYSFCKLGGNIYFCFVPDVHVPTHKNLNLFEILKENRS